MAKISIMKYLRTLIILLSLLPFITFAQSPSGEWNGTLEVPGFQLEMSITLLDDGSGWDGTLDIPMQNIKRMELADLSIQGQDIYFGLPEVPGSASFSGQFSDDYTELNGTFTQGGQGLDLSFLKASQQDLERIISELDEFEALIDSMLIEKKVPGIAVGLIKDGKILMSKGFGYRDYEHQKEVDSETIFAIGSTTKAFVTAGLAILSDENSIDWNTPVKEYLPSFHMYDAVAEQAMTPLDLVTHRSGLPRHDMLWYGTEYTRKELFDKLAYLEPTKTFRANFQYQNLMYMTAGLLIGEKSGSSWEEFTAEEIFRPLGMENSNFSVDESMNTDNFALPYKVKDDGIVQMDFRNIDNVGPAGSINSNVQDMLAWVELHLNRGTINNRELINDSQFEVLHEPQMIVGKGPLASLNREFSSAMYGAGWFVYQYDGQKVIQHGGNIDGFSAYVQLLPDSDIGMVFLSNKNGSRLNTPLAMELTDLLLNNDANIDWIQRAYIDNDMEDKPVVEDRSKKNTSPSFPISDYEGEYVNPAYGSITVDQKNGELHYKFHSFQGPLNHYHFDVFQGELNDLDQKFTLQFHMDQEANLSSLSTVVEPTLDAMVFNKLPPKQIEDRRFITAVEGEYKLENQKIVVRNTANELKLKITGQPEYTLEPYQKDEFKLKGLPGFSLRFAFDNSRRNVREIIFYQPNGTFRATPVE